MQKYLAEAEFIIFGYFLFTFFVDRSFEEGDCTICRLIQK